MTTHLALERGDLHDYLRSDYLSEQEAESEAEVPVPDRLLPKYRYRQIVSRLKLSQKIGLLVWMNRQEILSIGGKERLLFLQSKAPFSAIESGLQFAQRLDREDKLQSDFRHAMRELNRRPQSKRFRLAEKRRIGVGYRDKGTLPEISSRARQAADREGFVNVGHLSPELVRFVQLLLPSALTEDGEWIELQLIAQELEVPDLPGGALPLLTPL